VSLKTFSLQAASSVSAQRQDAQYSLDGANATKSRAADALTKVTGINIDQEMATLLDLEKSYQASSKVLTVINSMLGTLFEVVR
jgi:flagellar hook-associated protein 1 FlgK